MDMSPVHQVWPKPSHKAPWKGGRKRGRLKINIWEDNIREWTDLEFAKSQRAMKKKKWWKLVVKSFVVPQ